MSQVIWNDRIDAALSVLFVLVVVSIVYYGFQSCLEAYRADRWTAREAPATRDLLEEDAAAAFSAMR